MGKSILEAYRCSACPGLRDDYDPVIIPCGAKARIPPDCTGPCMGATLRSPPAGGTGSGDAKGSSCKKTQEEMSPCLVCPPPPDPPEESESCRIFRTLPNNFCDGE